MPPFHSSGPSNARAPPLRSPSQVPGPQYVPVAIARPRRQGAQQRRRPVRRCVACAASVPEGPPPAPEAPPHYVCDGPMALPSADGVGARVWGWAGVRGHGGAQAVAEHLRHTETLQSLSHGRCFGGFLWAVGAGLLGFFMPQPSGVQCPYSGGGGGATSQNFCNSNSARKFCTQFVRCVSGFAQVYVWHCLTSHASSHPESTRK